MEVLMFKECENSHDVLKNNCTDGVCEETVTEVK